MLIYKFVELFDITFIGSFGLQSGNLSSSVSVCGDVRDALLFFLLPASGINRS